MNEQSVTIAMPDTLTINGVQYIRVGSDAPTECAQQTCSYFSHYLIYYKPELQGEKLEHAAYHIAEKRCAEAQEKMLKWQDEHQKIFPYPEEPAGLVRQCEFWERKVAA